MSPCLYPLNSRVRLVSFYPPHFTDGETGSERGMTCLRLQSWASLGAEVAESGCRHPKAPALFTAVSQCPDWLSQHPDWCRQAVGVQQTLAGQDWLSGGSWSTSQSGWTLRRQVTRGLDLSGGYIAARGAVYAQRVLRASVISFMPHSGLGFAVIPLHRRGN